MGASFSAFNPDRWINDYKRDITTSAKVLRTVKHIVFEHLKKYKPLYFSWQVGVGKRGLTRGKIYSKIKIPGYSQVNKGINFATFKRDNITEATMTSVVYPFQRQWRGSEIFYYFDAEFEGVEDTTVHLTVQFSKNGIDTNNWLVAFGTSQLYKVGNPVYTYKFWSTLYAILIDFVNIMSPDIIRWWTSNDKLGKLYSKIKLPDYTNKVKTRSAENAFRSQGTMARLWTGEFIKAELSEAIGTKEIYPFESINEASGEIIYEFEADLKQGGKKQITIYFLSDPYYKSKMVYNIDLQSDHEPISNPFKFWSTVDAIIKDFVKEYEPDAMHWMATSEPKFNIYKRAQIPNYKFVGDDHPNSDLFLMGKHVKEAIATTELYDYSDNFIEKLGQTTTVNYVIYAEIKPIIAFSRKIDTKDITVQFYQNNFGRSINRWTLAFDSDDVYPTELVNPYMFWSTLQAVIFEFVSDYKPKYLNFTATDSKRFKLYKRLQIPGYELVVDKSISSRAGRFVRKD